MRDVSPDEILANECSFAPSRYLRKAVTPGGDVIPLGEICTAIRPPAVSKDGTGEVAVEVGIPELGTWNPLTGPFQKTVNVKVKAVGVAGLTTGDIVFSIKGTVGKVGLVGSGENSQPMVSSQSCIGLRLRPERQAKHITAEYLLMYLRSDEGQAQLTGLQVGAAVQHISPSTLLSSLMVPVLRDEAQRRVEQDYRRLCNIEKQVSSLFDQMQSIAGQRWTVE